MTWPNRKLTETERDMTDANIIVASKWASWCLHPKRVNQRSHGQNKNVSWEGTVFYSRATPIAAFYDGPTHPYVLITENKYSPSTGGQITRLGMALTGKDLVAFRVPYIGVTGGWSSEPRNLDHAGVLAFDTYWLQNQIYEFLERQVKSWRNPWDSWEVRAHSMAAGLRRWHEYTGAEDDKPINIDAMVHTTRLRIKEKRDVFFSPKAVAQRERAHARRVAAQALNLR